MEYVIPILVIVVIFVIALIVYLVNSAFDRDYSPKESSDYHPEREAGEAGERLAAKVIKRHLYGDDHLLCGVDIENDGKTTDLDCVVVNRYGIFIFEVKTYVGELYGDAEDYEWTKVKETYPGQTYEKPARNPIKQVNREIYLTKEFLKCYGFDVWVEGYAYLVNHNSPVSHKQLIEDENDFGKAIHPHAKFQLTDTQVKEIVNLFKNQ